MSDEEIAQLARRVDAINNEGGLWHRFRQGETVRVESRMVQSLAQVLEDARSPRSRVKVLMHFMGSLVPAQVPVEFLKPVADPSVKKSDARPPRRTRGRGRWVQGFGPALAGTT